MKAEIIEIKHRSDFIKAWSADYEDYQVSVKLENGRVIKVLTDDEPDWSNFNQRIFDRIEAKLKTENDLKRYDESRKAIRKRLKDFTGKTADLHFQSSKEEMKK